MVDRLLVMLFVIFTISPFVLFNFGEEDSDIPVVGYDIDKVNGIEHIQHEFHLGQLVPGEQESIDIVFMNKTDRDWVLGAVRTSCGCVSAEMRTPLVKVGEELRAAVVVKANQAVRPYEYSAVVEIDLEGEEYTLLIDIRGDVVPPILITPELLRFDASATSSDISVIRVDSSIGGELELPKSLPDWVKSVAIVGQAESSWDVELRWDPSLIRSEYRGAFVFSLRNETGVVKSPLRYLATPYAANLAAYPSQLFFGEVVSNQLSKKSATIDLSHVKEIDLHKSVQVTLSDGLDAIASIDVRVENQKAILTLELTPKSVEKVSGFLDVEIKGHHVLVPVSASVIKTVL